MYTRTFTDPSEREDPAQWPLRLYGGMACEYYRDSRCGLLTYLVVDPTQTQRGLARRLIQRAILLLKRDALDAGTVLRGVFSETEDPDQAAAEGNAMSPQQRLIALAHLGARRLDIPYVQART